MQTSCDPSHRLDPGQCRIRLRQEHCRARRVGGLPLDQELAVWVATEPAGLRGKVHAQLAYLRVDGQIIRAIEGVVEITISVDGDAALGQLLGDVSLLRRPAFRSVSCGTSGTGPLSVEGSLRLTPEPGFDLQGLVAPRPSASPDLAQDIRFLGSPDAQGRRPFSLESTF